MDKVVLYTSVTSPRSHVLGDIMPLAVLLGSPMVWVPLAVVVLLLVAALFIQNIEGAWMAPVVIGVFFAITVVSILAHIQVYNDLSPVEVKGFGWGTVVVETAGCKAAYPLNLLKVLDREDALDYPNGQVVSGNCGNSDNMTILFYRRDGE